MATASSSIILTTPTAAGSVASLKPISDCLQTLVTATVLLQTSDTGQVSWGSVSTTQVSTNNYEIFKLNDALNSTAPLFFKFVYATQVTAAIPKCTIQIGTGSDGAGNLTGAGTATIFRGMGTASTQDATSTAIYASAGDGYLNIFGGYNASSANQSPGGFVLSIERLRNSSGTALADGVNVIMSINNASGSGSISAFTPAGGGTSTTISSAQTIVAGCFGATRANLANLFTNGNNVWPPVMNRGGSYQQTPQFDGVNYLASAIQPYAGKLYNPGTACLVVDATFPSFSNPSLTLYGTAHTYQTLNVGALMPTPGTAMTIGAGTVFTFVVMGTYPALRFE